MDDDDPADSSAVDDDADLQSENLSNMRSDRPPPLSPLVVEHAKFNASCCSFVNRL